MSLSRTRAPFAEVVARPGFDLAEAALPIAREESPGLDVFSTVARLDDLSAQLERWPKAADAAEPVRRISELRQRAARLN